MLDQLIGGAGDAGVTHDLAADLLGYTPDTLLDEVVDAFAAGDGGAVFAVVDKVIETGQDPRRFTEDLLRRLRDLVIVDAVPGATASGLIDVSEDQGERLVAQAARFGSTDLSRAADIVATGLTEMRGATAPRLLLELILARVLLPGADHTTLGLGARLDRLERRLDISGTPAAAAPAAAPAPALPRPGPPRGRARPRQPGQDRRRVAGDRGGRGLAAGTADGRRRPRSAARHPAAPAARAPAADARTGTVRGAEPGRRAPPLARHRRGDQGPAPDGVDPPEPELPGRRARGDDPDARLHQRGRPRQLHQHRLPRRRPRGRDRRRRRRLDDRHHRRPGRAAGRRRGRTGDGPQRGGARAPAAPAAETEPEAPPASEPEPPATSAARNAAREAIKDTRPAGAEATGSDDLRSADADADRDDLVIDEETLGSEDLLARELGAQMIEEIPNT